MKNQTFAIILVLLVTPLAGCLKDSPSGEINGDEYNGTPLASGNAGDFSLIDRDSSNFSLSSLKGDITVVNFIFTSCPDVCPLDTSKLRTASNELGDDVKFVSITMDPEFDNVARLTEYSETHGADWPHLTGSPEQLGDVWSDFAIIVTKEYNDEMEHFNSFCWKSLKTHEIREHVWDIFGSKKAYGYTLYSKQISASHICPPKRN